MGFWSRAWKVATGFGGAMQAPVGLVKDLVFEATGIEDEHDGLIDTVWSSSLNRAGQAAGNLFGPEEGVGALAGGAPKVIRNPVGDVVGGTFNALETAYREGVGEPLSTAMTAASLAESNGQGLGGLFDGSNWRDAYKIAQHRSPGQAIALAIGTKDILDPNEVNEFVGTDFYKMASGVSDAVIRWTLSPDVLLGAGAVAARGKYLTRPLRGPDWEAQVDDYFRGDRWKKIDEFVAAQGNELTRSAAIRDRLFADHAQADVLSAHMARAKNSQDRESLMRFFMGDTRQIDHFRQVDVATANRLQRLFDQQALVTQSASGEWAGTLFADQFAVANDTTRLDGIAAEITDLTKRQADLSRLPEVEGVISNELRLPRQAITRSGLYQTSPIFKPVRVFTDMAPHRVIDVHRNDASILLDRALRNWGVSDQRRQIWRGRIDAALPEERSGLIIQAEHEAVRAKAAQYGLTKKEVETILDGARAQRQGAMSHIEQQFDPNTKRSLIELDDPDGELIQYPLLLTQTANAVPMADARAAERALKEAGYFKWRLATGNTGDPKVWDKAAAQLAKTQHLAGEGVASIQKVWKPAVLLRPAWTVRVVMLDEQFRMISKIGALATGFNFLQGGKNLTHATMKELFGDADTWLGKAGPSRTGAVVGGAIGTVTAGPLGAVGGAAIGGAAARALNKIGPVPFRQMELNGYKMSAAFGAPDDVDEVYRSLNSAAEGTDNILDVHVNGLLARFKKEKGWETRHADQATYPQDWMRVVNRQILADPMASQFVAGKSVDDVVAWLKGTAEGSKYQRALPLRKRNLEGWAETVKDMVDEIVPDVGDLRAKGLRNGRLNHADLAAHLDVADMPPVHAQAVTQTLGRGTVLEKVNTQVNRWFHILGTLPTDHLSRNPYFAHVYEAEIRRRIGHLPPGRYDEKFIRSAEKGAKDAALRETRTLLYDLAERSEFAEMMRQVIPFFPAYQEVLTRWAGLAVENPVFAARAAKVLTAPSKLPQNEADAIQFAGFKPHWYRNTDGDSALQFRLPEWAKGLVGQGLLRSAVDSQGYVRFDPRQFSMVGTGTPGFGPFVQLGVSEIVKQQPSLEDSVKFILPYGTAGEWTDIFLPAHVKRLQSLSGEEHNRAYGNAYARIITTKLAEMREGKIPFVDLDDPVQRGKWLEDVKSETDQFFMLRWATSFFSPVSLMFDSPYQAYIDAHRKLREADPSTADEQFLDQYGEEFFALTQSFTKSNNGIPPTLKGLATQENFGDLITRYPEFGPLIAGAEGSGLADKFSRAAYDRQLSRETSLGTGIPERSRFSPADIIDQPDVRLAWQKFSRAMDGVEAMRMQLGLPNLRVKAAAPLAEYKRQFVLALAEDYPAWGREYFTTDLKAWARKIEGLTVIANDPRLAGRPAIAGLRQYLDYREQIIALLASRDVSAIDATANRDIDLLWETIKSRLSTQPEFGELAQRWLENDPMTADTIQLGVAA